MVGFSGCSPWGTLFEEATPANPGHLTLTGLGTSEAANHSKAQRDALVQPDQDFLAELQRAEALESMSQTGHSVPSVLGLGGGGQGGGG